MIIMTVTHLNPLLIVRNCNSRSEIGTVVL